MANGGLCSNFVRHYKQACEEHPDMLIYDENFQQSMRSIMQDLYCGGEGTGSPSVLSFHVLQGAILYVVDNNIQTAKEIFAYKQEEIGGSDQILKMVRRYFKLCQTTLDSLSKLQVSLGVCKNKLTKVLNRDRPAEEVKKAVRCAEGVLDNLFLSLPHLIGKHVSMLIALQQQARDKDMPIRAASPEISTARKVTTIMLVTVFATAVICSFLVAALHAPLVLAVLPPVVISVVSWGPFIKWLDSFWVEDEEALTRRAAERVSVGKRRNIVIQEWEEIKLLTDDRERARTVLNTLLKNMTELDERMKNCRTDISMARRKFFEKITEPNRCRDRVRASLSMKAARIGEKIKRPFEKMSEKFDDFAMNRKF